MINNTYNNEKIIDCLYSKGYTNFLTIREFNDVKKRLKKNEYEIYECFKDSSKVILYKKNIPDIKLYKINTKVNIRHQDILGYLYSLGIKEETFGDVIKYQDEFYIFILPIIKDYLIYNFTKIKNSDVELIECSIELKDKFKIEYEELNFIVSSLRLDNVISTICHESRSSSIEKFKNKEITMNYNNEVKPTYNLRENDIFSIKRYGKYKYIEIIKNTKKGGFIIKILKYL